MDNVKSATALVSAFSRAYHCKNNDVRVFGDNLAEKLLSDEEYAAVAKNMTDGISFFAPDFNGNADEALRLICDNFLSATPLARAAFCEEKMKNATLIYAEQALIIAAGYDTFAYRQPMWAEPLEIFELDLPEMIDDKQARLEKAEIEIPENVHYIKADISSDSWQDALKTDFCFDPDSITFCSMLGITNYLTPDELKGFLTELFAILPEGSSVAFDYPLKSALHDSEKTSSDKRGALAAGAGEAMKAKYTYDELEALLSDCGLLIYEHCEPDEISKRYFTRYNVANPKHTMKAADDTAFCLAVKKCVDEI